MKQAIKNFALITLATVICLFLTWFYLRGRALSKPVRPALKHAFLAGEFPAVIAYRGATESAPANSPAALDAAAEMGPKVIIWIDVAPDGSGTPILVRKDRAGAQEALTLAVALARFPERRWILNLSGNREGFAEKIIAAVDGANAGERVLIQSTEDGLLKNLREKKPFWIFGTSQPQLILMKMLASIGLEATAPLKGDVLVAEWTSARAIEQGLDPDVVREAHRRNMRAIVGPVENRETAKKLYDLGVDAVISPTPSTLVDQAAR